MEALFLELIRVSIGEAVCLSHTPSAEEWEVMYAMAEKQALVGVCFEGGETEQATIVGESAHRIEDAVAWIYCNDSGIE